MTVVVRLFGPQALAVGAREVAVVVEGESSSIGELRRVVAEHEQRLAPSLPSSRFAVNLEFVGDDAVFNATDEVALIGMVAGG